MLSSLNEDAAAELTQHSVDSTVAAIQKIAGQNLVPRTGHCLFCNEPVNDTLYCDDNCKSDYEYQLSVRKHQRR